MFVSPKEDVASQSAARDHRVAAVIPSGDSGDPVDRRMVLFAQTVA